MNYRPDIDGLRAIAVLSVISFHAFPSIFPSGFIGVDIFFVISGYLITSIILNQEKENQFSLKDFYIKRIRRIFPALLTILFFCLSLGWIVLNASEYKQLGRYTAGGALFLNNFLFWKDAGYFDNEAAVKPLLHLWSLAIEEQFYLLWPFILWSYFKILRIIRKDVKYNYLLIFLIISVFASLLFSYSLSQKNIVANFYHPLARFWELGVGAILAFFHCQKSYQQPKENINTILIISGISLLLFAFFTIDKKTAFPGVIALLPTLSTACFIAANSNNNFNHKILANPILVWIGIISYPLYLWHWPLFSFARILEGDQPTITTQVIFAIVSFILAYLTYRLIERPIRFTDNRNTYIKKYAILSMILLMFGFLFIGYAITRYNGLPFRYYELLNADPNTITVGADRNKLVQSCGLDSVLAKKFEWCLSQQKNTAPNFAVIGDSKAEALYYGLARESLPEENWLLIGSFPVVDLPDHQPQNILLKITLERLEKDHSIKTVVIANSFRHIFPTPHINGFIEKKYTNTEIENLAIKLQSVIQHLQQFGKRVVFIVDNPTLPDPNNCIQGAMTYIPVLNKILYRRASSHCTLSYSQHIHGTEAYQIFLNQLKNKNSDLIVFDAPSYLCDIKNDICTYHENGNFLYSYGDHISDYANSKIAKNLLPLLRK